MRLYDIWYANGTMDAIMADSIAEAIETATLLKDMEIVKASRADIS